MRLLELVFVEIYEDDSDIIKEFVNPGNMEEGLVDGLKVTYVH